MRIQLKQNEIEEALKGFLTRQGIAVTGKSVKIGFTSGRKNNGLSVEILIEETGIKTLEETAMASVALDVQDGVLAGGDDKPPATEPVPDEVAGQTDAEPEVSEAPATKVGSLFG